MSDFPVSERGRHLDDEELSDLVDGVGTSDLAAHAESCPECGARLETWRSALRMISAESVTPDGDRRDQAVTAALAEFRPRPEGAAVPTPISAARRHRLRVPANVIGAVAAVVLVAGVVFAIAHAHLGSQGSKASSGAASTSSTLPSHSSPIQGSSSAGASGSASPTAASPTPASPTATSPTADGATAGRELGSFDSLSGVMAVVKPQVTTTPQPTFNSGKESGNGLVPSACVSETRSAAGVGSSVLPVYETALTFDGTPAYGLVFSRGGPYLLEIVRQAGCVVLAEGTF